MNHRILIIEDDPASLHLFSYLLEAVGYTILAAVDGEEGWEAARRERPDLIICDIQLPGMSGLDLVRTIKRDASLRRTPVIAVTAYAMVGDRDRMLAAGFDGYISKPIAAETFADQIEKLLHSRLSGKARDLRTA